MDYLSSLREATNARIAYEKHQERSKKVFTAAGELFNSNSKFADDLERLVKSYTRSKKRKVKITVEDPSQN